MWGVIPAAGMGTRIQPLAFSKELLPVGGQFSADTERPRAVSEYLVERMLAAGATRLCFVISSGKSDIMEYYGHGRGRASICYVVQKEPVGLCDAIFQALPFIHQDEDVLVGLPDTVWFPVNGFERLGSEGLQFLLFPVERPEFFDAVLSDTEGNVSAIQVKHRAPDSNWIWGAFRLNGAVLAALHRLWHRRQRQDQYIGTLVNQYIAEGGRVRGVRAGETYVDVGTLDGYRNAIAMLRGQTGRAGVSLGDGLA